MQKPLPQVRVYYSSLKNRSQSHNQLIHIFEQRDIPFELIDAFRDKVDSSLLEKDADGNIFFPQIFKFDHDRHQWVFAATMDSIVEWNDAGVLHARLATKPHPADDDVRFDVSPAVAHDHVPEWRRRARLSDYMSLIQSDDSNPYECDETSSIHPTAVEVTLHDEPTAKYSALERSHPPQVAQLEAALDALTGTNLELQARLDALTGKNQELQAQLDEQKRVHVKSEQTLFLEKRRLETELDEQKRVHVKSEQTLFLEKRRLETELNALRSKVAELAKTVEQQDGEIKTYDQIVESSQETIVIHERVKRELTERIKAHETRIAEMEAKALHLKQQHDHAVDELQEARATAVSELESSTAQIQALTERAEAQETRFAEMEAKAADERATAASELESSTAQIQALTRREASLQQSLVDQAKQIDELKEAVARIRGEPSTSDVQVRVDDLESRRQLLHLCRLQNDKERILITQLTSLFLP